jgi:PAS domain S-box-containing protein
MPAEQKPSEQQSMFDVLRKQKRLIVTFIGAMLFAILCVVGVLRFNAELEASAKQRGHHLQVLTEAADLLSALTDAETGQRGFLLTGDEAFLEPYNAVRGTLEQRLDKLFNLTKMPAAQQHLLTLRPLVQAKIAHLARLIALGRNRQSDAAIAAVRNSEGRHLMDAIRVELGAFMVLQESALAQHEAEFQTHLREVFRVLLFGCFCVLLLALLFAYLSYQQSQQRLRHSVLQETRALLDIQDQTNIALKQANSTLILSEERLAVTLNSIGDAVITTDAEARVSLLNPVAEALSGWTQTQAIGRPIAEIFNIIDKDTDAPTSLPVADALAHGTAQRLANHTVLMARDGVARDIAYSFAPIRAVDGRVIGSVLVFRDVSEDHAVQRELSDSSALIQTVLNTVADGIITLHANDGSIEKVNPAAEKMFGFSAANLHAQNFSKLFVDVPADGLITWLEACQERIATSASGHGAEVIGKRQDGTRFPMEIAVSEMQLGGERYFTGILRDISIRKKVEGEQSTLDQRLRDQQFYTRSLIESSIDALMTTDPSGIITDVNKQMEALTGCTRDELIGAPFKNYFTDPERAEAGIKRVLAENKVINYELTARARVWPDASEAAGLVDGPIRLAMETVVSYNASTFYDRDRKLQGVFAAARDITERKRLDVVLQESTSALISAKLAAEKANLAKSDFLSSMSHELRTPLNAILGFAQVLEVGTPALSAGQRRSIEHILQAGWYLLELINEILDLALIESGKLSLSTEPVSLAKLLQECQVMLEPQANKRSIRVSFPGPPFANAEADIFVKADRTRLKQVLINLLSNAVKYNCHAGTVDVTLEFGVDCFAEAKQEFAGVGRLRICITDSGAGLSPEKITQLFQPFNRLGQEANTEEGTGIGLVVAKRLIELMHGSIGVDSTPGSGCTFWIELETTHAPALVHANLETTPVIPAQAVADASRQSLLYVEDNPANMQLVEQIIESRKHLELIGARDAISGIELARSRLPSVILMDINLPGMSGIEALAILLADAKTAHIPVIALSANAIPRDIEKGLAAGFFRYLTKPIKVMEFLDTVDLALKSRQTSLAEQATRQTS